MDTDFEIFLATAPGLEAVLAEEAVQHGFSNPIASNGGVTITGGWPGGLASQPGTAWGQSRFWLVLDHFELCIWRSSTSAPASSHGLKFLVLMCLCGLMLCAVSQKFITPVQRPQRIETAIKEELGAVISKEAELKIMVRIEDDLCTISVDTSGELLHKRGHKVAVNKAPMRETLAAMFLRQCGYDGSEPVVDIMCGSGTFVLEAAEVAMGLYPGRSLQFRV